MADPDPRALALRLCKALAVNVASETGAWRSRALIASRAGIRSQVNVDRAIAYARAQRWLEVGENRDLCLTEKGARLD